MSQLLLSQIIGFCINTITEERIALGHQLSLTAIDSGHQLPQMQLTKETELIENALFVWEQRYTLAKDAIQRRDTLLARSKTVTRITNPEELELASRAGSDMQREKKQVSQDRLSLARILRDGEKRLMEIEESYTGELVAEMERLSRLATSYRKSEEERIAAELAKRQAEIAKLEKQRLDAEAKARKAAAKGDEAKSLAAEQQAYHAEQAATAAIMAPVPEVSKARGSSTRSTLKYTVLDIKKVYAARPELCKLEERASAIASTCFPPKSATALKPDTDSVPGLALWWQDSTSFR